MIGKKTSVYLLTILFSILTQKELKRLNILHITNIQSNDFFVFLIDRNNIDDLKKEKENNIQSYDINKFIKYDNNDFINYINKNKTKINIVENTNIKKENNINLNKENNNENNNINNVNNNAINNEIDNDNNKINKKDENNNIINNEIHNIIINDNNKMNDENNKIINNENNNIISEEINSNKKGDERINRIKSLINNSLSIVCNKGLQETLFLESNYIKFEKMKIQISDQEDILIDEYDSTNKSKLYLFSPISLLINNIKKQLEKNDFEIFNEDNNYIEMFGSYLEEVISKLNSFINEGKEKDYITNNKIKFACYHGHYYLCCQLSHEFKQQYYYEKQINEDMVKNNTDKINGKIEILKIKNSKNNGNEENLILEKEKKGKTSAYFAALTANKNYRNKLAYAFEKEVSDFICDNDCENLNNILFFLNLKIPTIIEGKEVEFQSVRLSFSENLGNLYGFREIDICMKNKNERTIGRNEILNNNICYINTGKYFKEKKVQEIDISLKKDSIIFCEVKNSFSTIEEGKEKCSEIQVKNIDNDINNNLTFDYMDRIQILYKKSKIFYNFFINEKIIDENKFMHILYLYDESNVSSWDLSFDEIKENISNFLQNQYTLKEFKNIIFQVAYFDREKYKEFQKKSIQELIESKELLRIQNQNLADENRKLKDLLRMHNIKYDSE